MMPDCARCGKPAARYMDIDFTCTRRRCGMKGVMDAKKVCEEVAMQGDEPIESKRRALKMFLFVLMTAKNTGIDDWSDVQKILFAIAKHDGSKEDKPPGTPPPKDEK